MLNIGPGACITAFLYLLFRIRVPGRQLITRGLAPAVPLSIDCGHGGSPVGLKSGNEDKGGAPARFLIHTGSLHARLRILTRFTAQFYSFDCAGGQRGYAG